MSLISLTKIEIRQLKKSKKIFAITMAVLLLLLSVFAINASTPVNYDHYNYMEINSPNSNPNGSTYNYYFCGYIVNKNLAPDRNVSLTFENRSSNWVFFNSNNPNGISTSDMNRARSILIYTLNHQGVKTESNGTISFNLTFSTSIGANTIQEIQFLITDFQQFVSFSIINESGAQDNAIQFTYINGVVLLPYYGLGNYGVGAVAFEKGNSSGSYQVKYTTYSNITTVSSRANLGAFSKGTPHLLGDNSQILSMNEAMNVQISLNNLSQGSMTFSPVNNNFNSVTFSGISELIYLITVMAVLLIVLMISTSIYDRPMNEFYQSLPEKRKNVILTSLIVGGVALAISSCIAYIAGTILSFFIVSSAMPLSTLFTLLAFTFSLYLVISPIFYYLGTTRIFNTGLKFVISFLLILIVPIVSTLTSVFFVVLTFNPFSQNQSILFLPSLNGVRLYNLTNSLIPILSPIELLNYMLKNPFPSVIMLNHQSLFYLSPIIIVASYAYWFIPLLYLTIKRYNKI